MYQNQSAMAANATASQKPEYVSTFETYRSLFQASFNTMGRTFLLSPNAAQSLPQQAQLALQQVDNCKSLRDPTIE